MTTIEWTDETWNPFVGCSKISPGCTNCYAILQAYRNSAMAQKMINPGRMRYYEGLTQKTGDRIDWTGKVQFVPEALEIPVHWKKPRRVFVDSMSDLFHETIPFEQIDQVFAVMALTHHHTYQVLTKRADERMLEYLRGANNRVRIAAVDMGRSLGVDHADIESCQWNWPLPNVWLGATTETQKEADKRIPLLLQTPAAVRFLSCEPLLEKINLRIGNTQQDAIARRIRGESHQRVRLDWVIIGGESGPRARPFNLDWARSLLQQCHDVNISAFVKQLGSNVFDESGARIKLRNRKGANVQEWPLDLQVREMVGVDQHA
jgi:protein gp37